MTRLLQEAIEALSTLPDDEQDRIASLLLEEIAAKWDESFARSQQALEKLAEQALRDEAEGHTTDLTFPRPGR